MHTVTEMALSNKKKTTKISKATAKKVGYFTGAKKMRNCQVAIKVNGKTLVVKADAAGKLKVHRKAQKKTGT
jgi:hypothetical protein